MVTKLPFHRTLSTEQLNIGLVTAFGRRAGETFFLNLVEILSSLSNNLYLLAPNTKVRSSGNIVLCSISSKTRKSIFAQILNEISLQLRMSCRLVRLTKKVHLWIFFEGMPMSLPILVAKILGGKVALALAGNLEKEAEFKKSIIYKPLILLRKINYTLADRIILYSQRLIKEWQLEKYREKILIAHKHFLDFGKFRMQSSLGQRGDLVGYIGRLSEAKGFSNFLEAMPIMLKMRNNLRFLIGGDGHLRERVEKYLSEEDLDNKATFVGWIPHDELPDYLNQLRLLVIPSYTEGLPNIMLEAMACGTPVLAPPIGVIPDVIKDGKTGFIMEDNSPDSIARNVTRALNHPNLEVIAQNAHAFVNEKFTYEKAVARYEEILCSLRSI